MARIALLTPTFFHYSGIDRVVEQQAKELSKNNDVTVIALAGDLRPDGFKVVYLGMPKSTFMQRLYRLLFFLDKKKIKNSANSLKSFDKIISHFYPMNWIAKEAKKHGVKYVYHNHGIGYSHLFTNPLEKTYMKLFGFLNKLSLKGVDDAVSISKFMRQELKKETGIQSTVEYNKIDKRFRKNLDKNKIRNKLGLKNKKIILFVGRISPHKNVHTLIEIFKKVNEKVSCKLIIIGKPTFQSYFNKLKKISNENVLFIENVGDKDLPLYYAACNVYATASLWEGFNLPVAEAQACGKKVVAFDVCSHPEIVKNGILVKKNDVDGFVKAILKIIT